MWFSLLTYTIWIIQKLQFLYFKTSGPFKTLWTYKKEFLACKSHKADILMWRTWTARLITQTHTVCSHAWPLEQHICLGIKFCVGNRIHILTGSSELKAAGVWSCWGPTAAVLYFWNTTSYYTLTLFHNTQLHIYVVQRACYKTLSVHCIFAVIRVILLALTKRWSFPWTPHRMPAAPLGWVECRDQISLHCPVHMIVSENQNLLSELIQCTWNHTAVFLTGFCDCAWWNSSSLQEANMLSCTLKCT